MISQRFDEWDEPEPLDEYDPELHQTLLVIDEDDTEPVAGGLRINQWVSTIPATTALQQERISCLLGQFGENRFRIWLRWLRQKEWDGDILVFFLQFLEIWEKRPHWWESYHWDPFFNCWRRTGRPSRRSLKLDDAYSLVRRRLDRHPAEAIDDAWLYEWEDLELWEKGFPSFASFAVFRAGFSTGEDWRQYIDWDTRHDSHDDADFDTMLGCYDERDECRIW